MAQNLTQATIHVNHDRSGSRRRVIPEKKDRNAWWKFLAGYPESAWIPRDRSVPKKLRTPYRMRAFADPAEVAHPMGAMGFPGVQSRDEPFHLRTAWLYDLPGNVPRQPGSLDIAQTTEASNAAPFAEDPSISSEVGEEHNEQLFPPEVTPSHLLEIDHVLRLLLDPILLLILWHSECQSTC